MTLYTSDYLEYYLTLVGWIISNGIWNTLVASGVFTLPFISIILQEWLKARGEGIDEGNKGALSASRIENRIWVAIVVIMFACIPFINIDISSIKYDDARSAQCQVKVAKPENTQWGTAFTTLNNQSAKVPIWWFFIHSLSRAITSSAVASIPCGLDLRQMRMEINNTRINDPILAQEVADFTHNCYGPARAQLFMSRPNLNEKTMHDVSWIGSRYFTNTPDYYDRFRSQTPRTQWPYNSQRDVGLPETNLGGGYPKCKQWWSDSSVGLRARLLKQVEPSLLSRFGKWIGYLSQEEVNDGIIRAIAAPSQQIMNRGQVYTDYGGQIDKGFWNGVSRVASDAGMSVGSMSYFPTMDVVRQALPLVLSFLKMAMVICLPLILLMGTYDLKAVVTLSCIEFALFFVDFWLQLARWIDSTIIDALYGSGSPHSNYNPFIGINNHFSDLLLNFVMGSLFIVLPMFWLGALSWVGIQAGAMTQSLTKGVQGAQNATNQGLSTITSIVKTAVTAALKK